MGLLEKLKGVLSGGASGGGAASSDASGFFFYVRCRCGEPIRVRVNRFYDLIQDYGESGAAGAYALTKVIVCPRCYKNTRAVMRFDSRYRELSRDIEGGSYIGADEYEQHLKAKSADS